MEGRAARVLIYCDILYNITERPINLPELPWWSVPAELSKRTIESFYFENALVLLAPQIVDVERIMVVRDGEYVRLNTRLGKDVGTLSSEIWLEHHANVTSYGLLEEAVDPFVFKDGGIFVADPFAVWMGEEETMVPNGVVSTKKGYWGVWKLVYELE